MKGKFLCPSCNVTLEFDPDKISRVKCPKCAHQGDTGDFKEIVLKSVFCPNCNAALKIQANAGNKTVACPKCQHSTAANNFLDKPKSDDSDKTELRGQGNPQRQHRAEDGETERPNDLNKNGKCYRPGKLVFTESDARWLENTKEYVLQRGINTLGRKSSNSTSSIQFPAEDEFMSRKHAVVEVIMREDATFAHRLSDGGSKNGVFHNGDRLEADEIINLMHGDTVRLGHTTFKFIVE
jgi:DNA-directed RNA polymerase subunit M/transcription elongation factor TFIIS